jgi:putative SOS response-associated peptidase YedK
MCGRYVSPDEAAIERFWHIGRHNNRNLFVERFNVQPTTQVPVIRIGHESGELELTEARWGLVPHWWSQPKAPTFTINAREEEAATKPMWRGPLAQGRCLLPAEGWYEWRPAERVDEKTGEVKSVKQPYFLHLPGRQPFCFAGILSYSAIPGRDEPGLSCAIMTRAASPMVAAVHDRMPVILPDDAHAAWLDPAVKDAKRAVDVARKRWLDDFQHYAVSLKVNNARFDDPSMIEPV